MCLGALAGSSTWGFALAVRIGYLILSGVIPCVIFTVDRLCRRGCAGAVSTKPSCFPLLLQTLCGELLPVQTLQAGSARCLRCRVRGRRCRAALGGFGSTWSSEGSWKTQALADLVRSGAEAHPGLVLEPFIGSKLEASGWEQ